MKNVAFRMSITAMTLAHNEPTTQQEQPNAKWQNEKEEHDNNTNNNNYSSKNNNNNKNHITSSYEEQKKKRCAKFPLYKISYK